MHLTNHFMSSCDGYFRVYGWGGKRFGEGFVNNSEDDIRHLLSLRLGKDRDTINSYFNHGAYLNDEAIKTLIEKKAPKDFFEKVQSKKRIEIKNELSGDNPSIERITKVISEFVLEEFEKLPLIKKIKKIRLLLLRKRLMMKLLLP